MHVHRLLKLQFVPLEHCVVWTCLGASVNAAVACMIWIRISDPRSLGSWYWHYKINQWIRLICHDPSDLNHWTWSGLSQWNKPLENSSSFNSGGFELMPSRLQNSICYIIWFISIDSYWFFSSSVYSAVQIELISSKKCVFGAPIKIKLMQCWLVLDLVFLPIKQKEELMGCHHSGVLGCRLWVIGVN